MQNLHSMLHRVRAQKMELLLLQKVSSPLTERKPEAAPDHRCLLLKQVWILVSLLPSGKGQMLLTLSTRKVWHCFFPDFACCREGRGKCQGEWESEKKHQSWR